MSKFQQALEDARCEVSIELYPENLHFQVYKPAYPVAHCWEVYLNPRKDDEQEIDTGCGSLDEAMSIVEDEVRRQVLDDERFGELERSALAVCDVCIHTNNPQDGQCRSCPVRTTLKIHRERMEKR